MFGAIIGDTIGSAYEFNNTKDYNFTLILGNSAYTDDSVMTMAVASWLLKDNRHSYQGLEDIMVMFAEKYPCPMGGYGGGFYTWLFEPEGLYNFDDRYGSAPPTGTAFGIGGATYFQDWGLRRRFLKTGEWAGFSVSSKNSQHYLLADYVPVGEAITLAMRTAIPWYDNAQE